MISANALLSTARILFGFTIFFAILWFIFLDQANKAVIKARQENTVCLSEGNGAKALEANMKGKKTYHAFMWFSSLSLKIGIFCGIVSFLTYKLIQYGSPFVH